ncbi:GNAT family N-acetyltransferase [Streptomyces lomondensis]|uniref:N-acetyltransferase n=1 Tax=Streptomyces lomondensis TaxID=68229 RepID=A0ABQ2WXI1_9ACTN|nr:GNAT family N-acetyltransferase [Streptomyces lomondensis]MCF0081919.1 GNAT family N-acetyltransferase [Streptomyces lomondensis]GGW86130.1 N-acetyltransferase [Streptomyces lomondensis]
MIEMNRPVASLVIRTVLPAEAEEVAALHRRARATYYPDGFPDDGADWRARWREAIARPDGRVLCAVRDGRMAAIASFRRPEGGPAGVVELFQFHVDPDRWRSGIGTDLHTACVEEWRVDGVRAAVLAVHAGNERARGFYARQGWVPDPEHPARPDDHHLRLRFTVPGE